jgi:hypothetical protein
MEKDVIIDLVVDFLVVTPLFYFDIIKGCNPILSDQKENKLRVLPHLLFSQKVCLRLTDTHMYTLDKHNRFIGCLFLEKSIKS